MAKILKLKDVEIGAKCTCPRCEKDVIAVMSDIYKSTYGKWDCEFIDVEISFKCPKCDCYFDVDMEY